MNRVQFSLVVTCRNEMGSLPRWYDNVMAQTRPPDEIVIVDSESTDGTTEFLRDWEQRDERVRVIVQKCKPARGHNIGNEAAQYEHILSTDMGVRLCPVWCEELIKPFESDPEVEIVAGNTQIDKETVRGAVARAEYYIENGGEAEFKPGFVPGNRSMAYTKKVWRELGGLPEDLTFYADDSVFGRQMVQAGYKMAYAPQAMTYWRRPQKLRDFCREARNYGRGDGEASIKTPFPFKLWQEGRLPRVLVPLLTGVRVLQKQVTVASVRRAVKARDVAALAVMPLYAFCRGFSFGKGYLVGDAHGEVSCQACRKRLIRQAETKPDTADERTTSGIAS